MWLLRANKGIQAIHVANGSLGVNNYGGPSTEVGRSATVNSNAPANCRFATAVTGECLLFGVLPRFLHNRVSQQRPDNNGCSDQSGQQPVCPNWQLTPER